MAKMFDNHLKENNGCVYVTLYGVKGIFFIDVGSKSVCLDVC